MNNFDYIRASDIDDALASLNTHDNGSFIAGGTNLIDLWKYNLLHPDLLIDINHLPGHHAIEEIEEGGVRLSAFLTNADTAYHPLIEERYPLLSKAILAGASAQIRNMATNGGNLLQRTRCYYFYDPDAPCNKRNPGSGCSALNGYNRIHAILGASENCIAVFPSDMCVALAALDAVVNVTGINGERNIRFEDFHRLPGDTPELDNNLKRGEIITSIDLPAKGFAKNYSYLKLRDRHSYAFALVSVATGMELDGDIIKEARIALGGVAHRPWRLKEAESFLQGKRADEHSFAAAADMMLEGAKGFKYNSFKIELAKKAIVRNGLMALDPHSQLPGAQPSA
ncbi:FAD binding domain-containing protein [Dyadobacter sp. MSC1_007]|jgi:xanthine dehydrogenase YagS FAD-binding subunit|uniref:FAD binding domain-containing protein n=1 Tax=Dyadobacter sp. MSC1_007 TaxID=2909264 RepID=UPI002030B88E|nr:xanthine dehydrogenase family protein subunit M [Dyadobacter sp. MSC1_007]